jgi:hypothetical protein
MRLCGLRAALAAASTADHWVLHDPRAWLGTAFHRLMEAMRRGATPADAETIWNAAIAETVETALKHPLDRRFAAPERWPSYFLVRQRAFALAAKLGGSPKPKGIERQLRLYAVIIADALGKWPASGRIVAAFGQTLEVKIDPAVCNVEADTALAALDALNYALLHPATWQHRASRSARTVHFRSSVPSSACSSGIAA